MYKIWDTEFVSLLDVASDPRCQTSYEMLCLLVRNGVPLEDAVVEAVCVKEEF